MNLIIYASNIHQGGGKSLLLPLLVAATKKSVVTAFLDKRLELPTNLKNNLNIIQVNSTLFGRMFSQFKLWWKSKDHDVVLCFGNLPPLFNLKSKVILYIQNRYLIDNVIHISLPLKSKVRIIFERLWLKLFNGHAQKIIVQTVSMQNLVKSWLGRNTLVIPFFDNNAWVNNDSNIKENSSKKYDFIYVASAGPQKNHINLLEAWKILSKDNIYPSLCLTLTDENYLQLIHTIEKSNLDHLTKIDNIQVRNHKVLKSLYKCANALIYPSLLESFGLPLLEAKSVGLPIIASELDYVRDVVNPIETFDPHSPISIARAVKRYMNIEEKYMTNIDSESFVDILFKL